MVGNSESQLVLQRIRNRLIEYFELVASIGEQRAYQDSAPHVSVSNEVFNQFGDWVTPTWRNDLQPPVFSELELSTLEEYANLLARVAVDLPQTVPELSVVLELECWHELERGASVALEVFKVRGKFAENE